MKPTFRWQEHDFGRSWTCTMVASLSNLGISADGCLMGNEEAINCWSYRVNGHPDARQRHYVEEMLYRQYMDAEMARLTPPPVRSPYKKWKMLLCSQ